MKVGFGGQWIELAKVGRAIDDKGVEHNLTKDLLSTVSANYMSERDRNEAPATIGHPVNNAPAFGWLDETRMNGDVLEGRFSDTADEFETMVRDGRFKKRSTAFFLDHPSLKAPTIKHIGFLGAAAPGVKGLRNIHFSEEGESFAFEETFNLQEKNMGLEDADVEKIKGGVLESIKSWFKSEGAKPADANEAQFSEVKLTELITGVVETATEKVKTELTAEFQEQLDAKDERITELETKVNSGIAGGVRAEIASFVEALPAEKGKHFLKRAHIADFLESLAVADAADGEDVISFSEGEGDDKTDHKFSRLEYAKTLLTSIAPMVEFGEKFGNIVATKEADAMIEPGRAEELKGKMGLSKKAKEGEK